MYNIYHDNFFELHMLSFDASQLMIYHGNGTMKIHERDSNNEWMIKQTILSSAPWIIAISKDFHHMLVISNDNTAFIYRKNNNMIWEENTTFNKITRAYFSANSRNMITIIDNEPLAKL